MFSNILLIDAYNIGIYISLYVYHSKAILRIYITIHIHRYVWIFEKCEQYNTDELELLRNENQNVLFTCIVFFLSLDECTFKRTVDIDCIRISKRIYRPCLRRVSRNATRFCIIYMYSWNYCNSSSFSCECSVHYIGLVYTAVHCWKYFYPTSKFGTKNPKLGSNNPHCC